MIVEQIEFEVAYAKPEEQVIIKVSGEAGMTVREAIEASRIAERFAEIDLDTIKIGIHGKVSKLDAILESGDRVEIYRALIADPKAARKKKAAASKSENKDAVTKMESVAENRNYVGNGRWQ